MKSNSKTTQDKLKLLYILNYINLPLTNVEVSNYILEYDIWDYFTLQALLNALCDAKFVTLKSKVGHDYYSVSQAGKAALDMFKEKLPEYFISEVKSHFSHIKKQIEKKRDLFGHYYKRKDDEYIVYLQVIENKTTIFNLSVNVPTEEIAKNIVKKWDDKPEDIFGQIITTLTET